MLMIILPTRDKSQVQPQTNQTSKTNRELVLDNTNIEMIISAIEKRRYNIPQHEATHFLIENQETNKIEALLTSGQNKDGLSPVIHDKINPVKLNGSYTSLKDPITKQPIIDQQGNMQPDPNAGGQYMATFLIPRIVSKDAARFYEKINSAQPYVDKHEKIIEKNIIKNKLKYGPQLPKRVGGQDDEPL